MAGASITVSVDSGAVSAALARLRGLAGDLFPVMDEIGSALATSTVLRFEDQRGPDGKIWPASLRARVEGGVTLTKSGRLRGSITHKASARSVEVGTNVIYAGIHQFGGTIKAKAAGALRFQLANGAFVTVKSVRMPARPFLGIDDADEADIADIVADRLRDAGGPGNVQGTQ